LGKGKKTGALYRQNKKKDPWGTSNEGADHRADTTGRVRKKKQGQGEGPVRGKKKHKEVWAGATKAGAGGGREQEGRKEKLSKYCMGN